MASVKIVIVDDDADLRKGLSMRLKANGYVAAFAADATSALSVIRREAPALLILDLGLPGGDGFLIMERLNAIPSLATIPVIVLSAREPADNEERAFALGAFRYFQKPVENEALLVAIESAIGDR